MKMAIDVYKYGRGGKCVFMFTYTHAGCRIINTQTEKEDKHMSRVMRITRAPCQRYVLNSKETKKEKKAFFSVINTFGYKLKIKHKPRRARNTGKKTGREESIHTRHRIIETGKQTRKVREGDQGYYW